MTSPLQDQLTDVFFSNAIFYSLESAPAVETEYFWLNRFSHSASFSSISGPQKGARASFSSIWASNWAPVLRYWAKNGKNRKKAQETAENT